MSCRNALSITANVRQTLQTPHKTQNITAMGEMRQYLSSSRLHDALRDNCLSCGANGDRQGTLDVLCVMVFLTVRNVLTAGDRHGSSAARDRNPIRGIRPGGTGENPLLLVLLQIPYPGKEANFWPSQHLHLRRVRGPVQ